MNFGPLHLPTAITVILVILVVWAIAHFVFHML